MVIASKPSKHDLFQITSKMLDNNVLGRNSMTGLANLKIDSEIHLLLKAMQPCKIG